MRSATEVHLGESGEMGKAGGGAGLSDRTDRGRSCLTEGGVPGEGQVQRGKRAE